MLICYTSWKKQRKGREKIRKREINKKDRGRERKEEVGKGREVGRKERDRGGRGEVRQRKVKRKR